MMSIIVFCEIGIVCLYCSLQMEKREWVKREKKRTIERQTLCSLNVIVFLLFVCFDHIGLRWVQFGRLRCKFDKHYLKPVQQVRFCIVNVWRKHYLLVLQNLCFFFFQDSVKPIKAKRENITNKQKRAREWWWEWHIVVTFAVPFLWDYAEILGTKLKGNKRWSDCFAKYFFMIKKHKLLNFVSKTQSYDFVMSHETKTV